MKRVIKKYVDELADLQVKAAAAKKAAAAAEKLYKNKLLPVLEYLDVTAKVPATKGVELQGERSVVAFGAKKVNRVIKDQVEVLRRLENVRDGLGFENIKIALKVLDNELRADEVKDLIKIEYGGRSVKVTKFEQ